MRKNFNCIKANALFLKGRYKDAFEAYFRGATEFYDLEAAINLAYMYSQGYYVPRNYYMARRFYESAEEYGEGEACFNLALIYIRGLDVKADFGKAMEYMKKAAAKGCIDAQLYLGNAYTLGCVFDPLNIECISLIPYYRIIPRDTNIALLMGAGLDEENEIKRFETIRADEYDAFEMFQLAAEHKDDTYISSQLGTARFMVGQALIEGFGKDYSPIEGYRLIEKAASDNLSEEAARWFLADKDRAKAFGVDVRKATAFLHERDG